jgi:hypothetical protein
MQVLLFISEQIISDQLSSTTNSKKTSDEGRGISDKMIIITEILHFITYTYFQLSFQHNHHIQEHT